MRKTGDKRLPQFRAKFGVRIIRPKRGKGSYNRKSQK